MYWYRIWVGIALIFTMSLHASLTFENKTNRQLYLASYYIKESLTGTLKESKRTGSVLTLEPGKKVAQNRPKRKFLWDREVVVSEHKDLLTEQLSGTSILSVAKKNIGLIQGNNFIIDLGKDEKIKVYRSLEWELHKLKNKILEPLSVFKKLSQKVLDEIKLRLKAIKSNSHKAKIAQVRNGQTLSAMEEAFRDRRAAQIQRELEKNLGIKVDNKEHLPNISLVFSGGGYRAMYLTLGFLQGADKIGILDSSMYISAVSGSAWMLGFWMAHGIPFHQVKEKLIKVTTDYKGLTSVSPVQAQLIADMILTDFVYHKPITMVDFYGALIANILFDDFGARRQMVYLSNQAEWVKTGKFPMPIYTAVAEEKVTETTKALKPENNWYEFTPFEVGGTWLESYIPTWSLGRKFEGGVSVDDSPEMTFGQLLGICGSAFTITFQRMYEEVSQKISPEFIRRIIKEILKFVSYRRLTTGQIYNFVYGTQRVPLHMKYQPLMRLGDAGINCNFGYDPIGRPERKVDVIIFLDCSSSVEGAPALRCAQERAGILNRPFPDIDYTDIDKKAISIFKDEQNPQVPVVIYMPRIKDKELWNRYKKKHNDEYVKNLDKFDPDVCTERGMCKTTNFRYATHQAMQLIYQAEFNIIQSSEEIKEVIRWKTNQKKAR